MGSSVIRRLIFVVAILSIPAFPVVGYAQEAVLGGTVTDSTGAVLPGVTVKAVLYSLSFGLFAFGTLTIFTFSH